MKWHVAWRRSARNDLAGLWLDPALRAAITDAANRIDKSLEKDPLAVGESRDKDRRVLIELPLGIIYKVNSVDYKVIVLRLWCVS